MLEQCKASFKANPSPRKLGKTYCFLYDPVSNTPTIVIGPDWQFSIVKWIAMNSLAAFTIFQSWASLKHNLAFTILGISLAENFTFILTMLINPGLAPRNPQVHSQKYLNEVQKRSNP